MVDMQKRILLWSDGAQRITNQLRYEVIGRSSIAEPLLHCNQPGCEFCNDECPLVRAMKRSHGAESNGALHHKSGYEVPVGALAVPGHVRPSFKELEQACRVEEPPPLH